MTTDSDKLQNADIAPEPVDGSLAQAAEEGTTLDDATLKSKLMLTPISPEPTNGSSRLAEDGVMDLETSRLNALLVGLKQDITERKSYASKLFRLLTCWMTFVAVCIVMAGLGNGSEQAGTQICWLPRFVLSDSILIALLTGATVNLIALFAIVAWYLFPKK